MLVLKITEDNQAKLNMASGMDPKDVVVLLAEVMKTLINDYCYTDKKTLVDSIADHLMKGESKITIH